MSKRHKHSKLTPGKSGASANDLFARALAAHQTGNLHEAEALYKAVLAVDGKSAIALNNMSIALRGLNRLEEALASAESAIAVNPDYVEAHINRGIALHLMKRTDEALASYNQAIAIKPDYAEAYSMRGVALQDLQQIEEALASYDRAIALNPHNSEAYSNRSVVLLSRHQLNEAVASADQAIALKADYAEPHYNRGAALLLLKRWDEAIASFDRAIVLNPNMAYALSNTLHSRMNICDWHDYDLLVGRLLAQIERGETVSAPFTIFSLPSSLSHQQKCAVTVAGGKFPQQPLPLPRSPRSVRNKIRLGYFSADFHNHPVSQLIVQLFQLHDRSRFEVYGFSFDLSPEDDMRRRISAACDQFITIAGKSNADIAAIIQDLEIDIAVDLGGHTLNSCLGFFAYHPAPVQLHYLGFAGTIGAPYIDYMVADLVIIPAEHQQYYAEKIIYLPDSFMVSDSQRVISDRIFTREELGLPAEGFVFCCFNNSYKITPDLFAIWLRLLKQVEGSVLWLSGTNDAAADNLRKVALANNVAPERIVFAQRTELLEDHLARHGMADLFLDTFYHNAHTTANDALWAGLPVLTCRGETLASRVAASLLQAVGLPELITRSHQEYETAALDLATHPEKLRTIRTRLAEQRTTHPLFDTQRFAWHLEDGYRQVWARYQAGLLPDHVHVVALSEADLVTSGLSVENLFARAIAAHQAGNLDQAVGLYWAVLEVDSRHAVALYNLSVALRELRRLDEALACIERALVINPNYSEAYVNQGVVLHVMNRLDEALTSYDRAIAINPDYAEAYRRRGVVLQYLKRPEEALTSYDRAIALNPNDAQAYGNRGVSLVELKQLDEAIASYDRAIALSPDYAESWYNRGNLLLTLKRWDETADSYERAIALKIGMPYVNGMALHCRMNSCDWRDYDQQVARLLKQVEAGEEVSAPFPIVTLPSSLAQQQQCAIAYTNRMLPEQPLSSPRPKRTQRDKIRLGYFSADFHNHPIAYMIAELFELHDRSRFEVIGFSVDPCPEDEMRRRISAGFDRFITVTGMSHGDIANIVQEMEIDIAIDLGGHTTNSGLGIFAYRPAPVQIHYFGYPGTLGTPYIDYLVGDSVIIPEEHRQYYSEKIINLPDSFMVSDSKRRITERVFTREELGLPAEGFIFCSFNNSYKITPDLFAIWMRLLEQVEGSVLWLLESNKAVAENLSKAAIAHNVAAERIIFAKRTDVADHLARQRVADLFLDTFYYNAHTTANEALWVGLPILTCLGESFVSRVAASLIRAVGLPELITYSPEEYETVALDLATHPEKLKAIRTKLAEHRTTSPLFDSARFARNLEDAYVQIWARHQAGLLPDHIHVTGPTDHSNSSRSSVGDHTQGAKRTGNRNKKVRKLHIGGVTPMPGWEILNILPGPHVDHIGNANDLSQFSDASFDDIYASHVLEHLDYKNELVVTLKEWHRVLKPSGRLYISVPDLDVLAELFLAKDQLTVDERFYVMRIMFGGHFDDHDYHQVGLNLEFLVGFLKEAGFDSISKVDEFGIFEDTSAWRYKGELVSLNLIATK